MRHSPWRKKRAACIAAQSRNAHMLLFYFARYPCLSSLFHFSCTAVLPSSARLRWPLSVRSPCAKQAVHLGPHSNGVTSMTEHTNPITHISDDPLHSFFPISRYMQTYYRKPPCGARLDNGGRLRTLAPPTDDCAAICLCRNQSQYRFCDCFRSSSVVTGSRSHVPCTPELE
jgi:hypothetical protein